MNWDLLLCTLLVPYGIYLTLGQAHQLVATFAPTTKFWKIFTYGFCYGFWVLTSIMLILIYLRGFCGLDLIK